MQHKDKEQKMLALERKAIKQASQGVESIKIPPTSLSPEVQAQIEQKGYASKDGFFEKSPYSHVSPPIEKPVIYADWKQ